MNTQTSKKELANAVLKMIIAAVTFMAGCMWNYFAAQLY